MTAALYALKRKKAFENELDRLGGTRMTLETQVGGGLAGHAGWGRGCGQMQEGNPGRKEVVTTVSLRSAMGLWIRISGGAMLWSAPYGVTNSDPH